MFVGVLYLFIWISTYHPTNVLCVNTIYDIYKLLHVSTPSCHPYGVILAKAYKPAQVCDRHHTSFYYFLRIILFRKLKFLTRKTLSVTVLFFALICCCLPLNAGSVTAGSTARAKSKKKKRRLWASLYTVRTFFYICVTNYGALSLIVANTGAVRLL